MQAVKTGAEIGQSEEVRDASPLLLSGHETISPSSEVQIARFLIERFSKLTQPEQAFVLTSIINRAAPESQPMGIIAHANLFKKGSPVDNRELLVAILEGKPTLTDIISRTLARQYDRYFPALLSLQLAATRGEDVGILTARENKVGHILVLEALQKFTEVDIPFSQSYFINDATKNERLIPSQSATRKYQILYEYARGVKRTLTETPKEREQRYDKIYFYDNEDLNLKFVHALATIDGLRDVIIPVDARALNQTQLWERLVDAQSGVVGPRERVLHFFDLDSTVINLPSNGVVHDPESGVQYLEVPQADWAKQPNRSHWINLACRLHPEVDRSKLVLDFLNAKVEEFINRNLKRQLVDNRIFKL